MTTREETLEKIRLVMDAEEDELEKVAISLDPDFEQPSYGREILEFEWAAEAEPEETQAETEVTEVEVQLEEPIEETQAGAPESKPVESDVPINVQRKTNKKKIAIEAAAVVLLAALGYLYYDWFVPKTIQIEYEGFKGNQSAEFSTTARTTGAVKDALISSDLFQEDKIEITDETLLVNEDDERVKKDCVVVLKEVKNTKAKIGGKTVEFRQIPGTVKENLALNEVAYDKNDEIRPALDKTVKKDTSIVVNEVHYKTKEKTETVKAEDTVILDPEMESGVQKTTKGNDGKGVFTYRTKYVNGKKSGTEKEVKKWIKEPHDNTLHLGTGRTGHKGKYRISSTFTANCSAYWMGNNCYGAGGGKCVYGTVAVDRHRYPYGTMFWIEGYGFAVANDCGTSIKGDKLDLWMDSYAESCRWGRRHMTTYVLEEVR